MTATQSTAPITFPPIYSGGYLDGDRSRVYQFDTRFGNDPVCTFVLLSSPRYVCTDGVRQYTRTADIRRFTPL